MRNLKVGINYRICVIDNTKMYLFDGDSVWLTLEQAHCKYSQKDFTWVNSNLPDRNRKVNMTEVRTENFKGD